MITQIKKRDGEIVNYNEFKIVSAISRASEESGEDISAVVMANIIGEVEV